MKFKKIVSYLIVSGIIFSNIGFAFGESINVTSNMVIVEEMDSITNRELDDTQNPNLSEAKAVELAQDYINDFFNEIISEEEGFHISSHYSNNYYGNENYVWRIEFYRSSLNNYVSYSVTIDDEDKSLSQIRRHKEPTEDEPRAAQFTQEEAEEMALKFLRDFNPKIMNDLILNSNYQQYYHISQQGVYGLNPREYSVFYPREHNGIPVMNQGVELGINNATGEVSSYRFAWDNDTLPSPDTNITSKDASKLLKDNISYNLIYVPVRDRSSGYSEKIEEVRLVYAPNFQSGMWVDAKTGEMLNQTIQPSGEETRRIDLSAMERRALNNITEEERTSSEEMSRDEAIKFAKETLDTLYPDLDLTINQTNYSSTHFYDSGERRKTWDINFQVDNEFDISGNISVDAITAEIIRLNLHNWRFQEMLLRSSEEFSPEIKWEDAYYNAIEVLKVLYPNKLKHLDFAQVYSPTTHHYNDIRIVDPEYYFTFSQVEHGIPYSDNYINISIDSSNGLVQRVNYRWNDVEFPKSENIIEEELAMNLYLQQTEVELNYITIYDRINNTEESKLVFGNRPKNSVIHQHIDAHTGELLDYTGQLVPTKDGVVKDINGELEGHWAERKLKIMAANGVIDLDKLSLGDKMTKYEIIKMMVNSVGRIYHDSQNEQLKYTDLDSSDEYYRYLEQAVQFGFIDNEEKDFNGYNNISREEFAGILINMTTLKKASQIQDIYTLPVEDIEEIEKELLGAIALIYGLEIMTGSDNNFKPKDIVTLEQAAAAIYRAYNLFGRSRW